MILLKASEALTLKKAKEMPVGTVSKGRKKVAKGKWVPVPTNRERKEPVKDGERKQLANKGGVSLYHNHDNTYSVYHGSLKYGSESFKTEAEARKRLVEIAKDVKSGKLKPPSSESLLDMY